MSEAMRRHGWEGTNELSYGETPSVTMARILELAGLPPGSSLLDLGAGRGSAVLTAACLGYQARGIEIVGEYVERAQRVAARLATEVELRQGDMLEIDWPRADLYLLNSTAFPEGFRGELLEKLVGLEKGALVATYDWGLGLQNFHERVALTLPVTRGTVVCRLYRIGRAGDS